MNGGMQQLRMETARWLPIVLVGCVVLGATTRAAAQGTPLVADAGPPFIIRNEGALVTLTPASPTSGLSVTWTQIEGVPAAVEAAGNSVAFVLPVQRIPSNFAPGEIPLEPEVKFQLTVRDPRTGAVATDTIQVVRALRILVQDGLVFDEGKTVDLCGRISGTPEPFRLGTENFATVLAPPGVIHVEGANPAVRIEQTSGPQLRILNGHPDRPAFPGAARTFPTEQGAAVCQLVEPVAVRFPSISNPFGGGLGGIADFTFADFVMPAQNVSFRITASDAFGQTALRDVTFTARPVPLSVTIDKRIVEGILTSLNLRAEVTGTASSVLWTQISGPPAPLANDDFLTVEATPASMIRATYVFRLRVSGRDGMQVEDTIRFDVTPPPGARRDTPRFPSRRGRRSIRR